MRFSPICTRFLRISVLSLAGLMLALGILTPQPSQAQGLTLYSVTRDDDQLRVIDPSSGATLSSVTITFAGDIVNGAHGLARNPVTDELFALLRLDSATSPARQLVILDPTTGVATDVGDTGDGFAGLAFDSGGTLFAVTGDGANTDPESLFTLDTTDATPTLVDALGNGTTAKLWPSTLSMASFITLQASAPLMILTEEFSSPLIPAPPPLRLPVLP